MADDRIDIVFGADTGEFDAGIAAVAGTLDALASPAAMLQESLKGIGDAFAASVSVAAAAADGSYAVARSEYQKEVQLIQDRFKLGKLTAEEETAALIAAENKRFAAQEASLSRTRAQLDQGSAAYERAEERKEIAVNEHERKLDQLRTQGIEQQIKQEEKAASQTVQSANRTYAAKIALLDNEYRQHKISLDEQIAAERAAEEERYRTDLAALQPLLQNDNLRVEQRRRILGQIQELEATHARDLAAIDNKELQELRRLWGQTFGQISSAFDGALNGWLRGTTTFSGAMKKLFDTLAIDFIADVIKMMAQWAAFRALQAVGWDQIAKTVGNPFTGGSGLGGLVGGLFGGGGGNAQLSGNIKTLNTTLAGNTAATATNSGGLLQGVESTFQWIAEALGLTSASVTQAGATTANTAVTTGGLIPAIADLTAALYYNAAVVGSSGGGGLIGGLSPAAALSAGIIPLAAGAWNIPSDMIALLHQGEAVLPASQAALLRAGAPPPFVSGAIASAANLNGSLTAAAAGGGETYHFTIQAIDTQTGAQFLKNNAGVIAQAMAAQKRNASKSFAAIGLR